MRKFKLTLWILLLAVLGLFFYQNKGYFLEKPVLTFQIPFFETYHIPQVPNAVLFLAFLVLGLLVAYFFSLLERFKANRQLKTKDATISSQMEEIASLKGRMHKIQGDDDSAPAADSPAEKPAVQPAEKEAEAAAEDPVRQEG